MKKIRKLIIMFKPPFLWSCLLAIFFTAGTLYLLFTGNNKMLPESILYIIYVAAFLSLLATVWSIILYIQTGEIQQKLLDLIHKFHFTTKLYEDYSFRTIALAFLSFWINILFAAAKGIVGYLSMSSWLIAFAVYYIILCIAKMVLISGKRNIYRKEKDREGITLEWRAYRLTGMLLIVLHAVLQGIVQLIVKMGGSFSYFGNLILAVALYDFICLISCVIYILRNRKKHSPIIVAVKIISFVTSLVSILSLQTAMFAAFGSELEMDKQRFMNIATGEGICLIVFLLSIYMMIHATRKIHERKELEES